MREGLAVSGKVVQTTSSTTKTTPLNNRGMSNSKGAKPTLPQEMEPTPARQDSSSPRKKTARLSTPAATDSKALFEHTVAGVQGAVSMLLSEYAEVLSERAAMSVSQVGQLEGILREARSLEAHLKEKKGHLRQTLALISDQLQG